MGVLLEDGRQLARPGERQSLKRRRRRPLSLLLLELTPVVTERSSSFFPTFPTNWLSLTDIFFSADRLRRHSIHCYFQRHWWKLCYFPLHLDSKNTVRLFRCREMSVLVFQRCTYYLEEFLFFFSVEVLRRHMHKKFFRKKPGKSYGKSGFEYTWVILFSCKWRVI